MARNRPMSETEKGCAMLIGIPLVMLMAVFMFVFFYLPMRLFIGASRLLGFRK